MLKRVCVFCGSNVGARAAYVEAAEKLGKLLAEQGIGADFSAEERSEIARKVGIATIKFADLSNHRTTDYVFDLERFSKFEGKTGPYLQYAAVRIQSILRKAGNIASGGTATLPSPEEQSLALQLLALADAMAAAEDKRAPNMLCEYAFELAQNFSRFYNEHHVLSEPDSGLRAQGQAIIRPQLSLDLSQR